MQKIQLNKPKAKAARTNKQLYDQGITYNHAGISYNEIGIAYGGIYGQDIVPIKATAKDIKPR